MVMWRRAAWAACVVALALCGLANAADEPGKALSKVLADENKSQIGRAHV